MTTEEKAKKKKKKSKDDDDKSAEEQSEDEEDNTLPSNCVVSKTKITEGCWQHLSPSLRVQMQG